MRNRDGDYGLRITDASSNVEQSRTSEKRPDEGHLTSNDSTEPTVITLLTLIGKLGKDNSKTRTQPFYLKLEELIPHSLSGPPKTP